MPIVEEEEKEVITKDTSTGEEKKEKIKVPVTKNKVVKKSISSDVPLAVPASTPIAAPASTPIAAPVA